MPQDKSDPKNDLDAQAKQDAETPSRIPLFRILQDAIRAVPAVRYALGVAGIVAAIAIVKSFGIDLRIAGFGTIITFVLMVVLLVFAKLSKTASKYFVAPVLVMMWSFLILTILTAVLLFSSAFFQRPLDLQDWLKPRSDEALPDRVAALSAGEVLKIAYAGEPPTPPVQFVKPLLQFEILAKRNGDADFIVIKDGDSLASKVDDYCVVARGLSDGYLYIFQVDSSGKAEWLFPKNDQSKFSAGSNPVVAKQIIQFPPVDQDRILYLDNTTGVEHIYAVFSATRWNALENALANLTQTAPASQLAAPVISVQVPNGLRLRGVGGTRVTTQTIDVETTLSVERIHEGKPIKLRFASKPLEASGPFLVEERWFEHVAR